MIVKPSPYVLTFFFQRAKSDLVAQQKKQEQLEKARQFEEQRKARLKSSRTGVEMGEGKIEIICRPQ